MSSHIASVHEGLYSWKLQRRSIQNALFHRNAIRSAFLYSDSISSTVQATGIQKISRRALGCNFSVILQDTRFRFPNYHECILINQKMVDLYSFRNVKRYK